MSLALDVGFLPLCDCAPLVAAYELGFAAEEGIELTLRRERSWSALRDKLALNRLDAAHMLSPTPIAMSMGLGGLPPFKVAACISVIAVVRSLQLCTSRPLNTISIR